MDNRLPKNRLPKNRRLIFTILPLLLLCGDAIKVHIVATKRLYPSALVINALRLSARSSATMFGMILGQSIGVLAAGLLIAYLLYLAGLVFYRLYLSPIAKFPGPRLAAATYLFEGYYDVVKRGKYTFKIRDLHAKYGQSALPYLQELNQFANLMTQGPSFGLTLMSYILTIPTTMTASIIGKASGRSTGSTRIH